MPKRLPPIEKVVIVDSHGATKLTQTWFQCLHETNPSSDEIIIGIDETGRGPIFGPMIVGGCANPTGWFIPGVKDSKEIRKEATRKTLASEIQHNTIWTTATISVDCINRFGTLRSLMQAGTMVAAEMIAKVRKHFSGRAIRVIFDGRDHPNRTDGNCRYESIEKADATIYEVSCASIVAKVLHDNLVGELVRSDQKYQHYDLDSSKGYGTARHKAALEKYGPTDQHRTVAYRTLMGLNDNGKTRTTSQ